MWSEFIKISNFCPCQFLVHIGIWPTSTQLTLTQAAGTETWKIWNSWWYERKKNNLSVFLTKCLSIVSCQRSVSKSPLKRFLLLKVRPTTFLVAFLCFWGGMGGIFLTPGDEYEPILYSSKNISELNLVKGLYKKIFLKRFLLLKGIVQWKLRWVKSGINRQVVL